MSTHTFGLQSWVTKPTNTEYIPITWIFFLLSCKTTFFTHKPNTTNLEHYSNRYQLTSLQPMPRHCPIPETKHQTPCTKQDMCMKPNVIPLTPQGHFAPQLYLKTVQVMSSLKTSSQSEFLLHLEQSHQFPDHFFIYLFIYFLNSIM